MSSKQPDVDRLIKADKKKAGSMTDSPSSNIHLPRGGARTPTPKSKIPTIRLGLFTDKGSDFI